MTHNISAIGSVLRESAVESDLEPDQNPNKIDHQLMYIDKIVVIYFFDSQVKKDSAPIPKAETI